MKRKIYLPVLLYIICSVFGYYAMAQEEEQQEFNTKKFEINIGIADIFAKNDWWYSAYYLDEYGYYYFIYPGGNYYKQPNLIVGFKYHCNKGALRLGMKFNYNSGSFEDIDTPGTKFTHNNLGSALSLGYEWHSTFGRVNVYYGFDGSFSYAKYFAEWEQIGSSTVTTDRYTLNESTLGISPLVGVNYFITPNLSVGTEVKFTAEYASGKSKDESFNNNPHTPNTYVNEQKSSGFRTYFGPLGFLSLNIHL